MFCSTPNREREQEHHCILRNVTPESTICKTHSYLDLLIWKVESLSRCYLLSAVINGLESFIIVNHATRGTYTISQLSKYKTSFLTSEYLCLFYTVLQRFIISTWCLSYDPVGFTVLQILLRIPPPSPLLYWFALSQRFLSCYHQLLLSILYKLLIFTGYYFLLSSFLWLYATF